MASPLTVWSTTADGWIRSINATYATAAGATSGGGLNDSGSTMVVGQEAGFSIYESFVGFDTSGVGAENSATAATLSVYGNYDQSTTDFVIQARLKDWGGSLDVSTDWVKDSSLGALTLLASYATSGGFPTNAYTALTGESAFLSNIAKTGTTYILLNSDRHASTTQPPNEEDVYLYSANDATGVGGTDRDPKLYVEYGVPAVAPTVTIVGISAITENSAASGGWVVAEGSAEVTERGVCWNMGGTPTIADSHTHD